MLFASFVLPALLCLPNAEGNRPSIEELIRLTKEWAEKDRSLVEGRVKEILTSFDLPYEKNSPAIQEKIEELAKLGPRALPWLLPLLDPAGNDDREIQRGRNSARVVGRIGSREILPAILKIANSGTAFGKENAAYVLGAMRAVEGERTLCGFLNAQTPAETRRLAIWALGQIKNENSVEALVGYLKEADQETARAILGALENIRSPKAVAPVAGLLAEPYFRPMLPRLLFFFQNLGGQEALPQLLKAIGQPEWNNLQVAQILQTIGKLGAPSYPPALPTLKPLLSHAEKDIRDEAAFALNELGDESGVKALLAPYDDYLKDFPRDPQGFASRGKIYLRLRKYREGLKDFKDAVRVARKEVPLADFYVLQARCYGGLGQIKEAHSALKTSNLEAEQLARYKDLPEFKALREHEKYGQIFK